MPVLNPDGYEFTRRNVRTKIVDIKCIVLAEMSTTPRPALAYGGRTVEYRLIVGAGESISTGTSTFISEVRKEIDLSSNPYTT